MKQTRGLSLFLLGFGLVVLDQAIKIAVKSGMSLGQQIPVLGEWFRLCYVENEGMAFGLKWGGAVGKYVLTSFRLALSGALIVWIRSLLRKEEVPAGVPVGLTLIAAGAIGNVIDCCFYGPIWGDAPFMLGKVVDMFYFPIIRNAAGQTLFFQPVFNFADSCVTVGAFYLILFQWKFFSSDGKKK